MEVIPAINCKDFKCVKERILKASEFLKKGDWIQFDISDGKFTPAKTWDKPEQLKNLKTEKLKIEVHLMVNDPEKEIKKWSKFADRMIIHLEALEKHSNFQSKRIGIAIKSDTPVKKLFPYLNKIKFVQLLAVTPGFSGGKFDLKILRKIKEIKKNHPKIKIEIDGGANEKTVKLIKRAGADIVVSASHIFENKNPKEAFDILRKF